MNVPMYVVRRFLTKMARISSQVEDATLEVTRSSQDDDVFVKIVGTRKFFRNRRIILDTLLLRREIPLIRCKTVKTSEK